MKQYIRQRPKWRTIATVRPTPDVVGYEVRSTRWNRPPLFAAILSDIHAMWPWTPLGAVDRFVAEVNAMAPDVVFVLGDYTASFQTPGWGENRRRVAQSLSALRAPLGTHTILGNHDWTDDPLAVETDLATSCIAQELAAVGLPPLVNEARQVEDFWIVGFDSQRAPRNLMDKAGREDPALAFADVPDGAPVILLAHEPDYFEVNDTRPILQLSGHTHGGQVNMFGWRPLVPSNYGGRYAYGQFEATGDRHMIVSGGLGYTHFPMRILQPPEITLFQLCGPS